MKTKKPREPKPPKTTEQTSFLEPASEPSNVTAMPAPNATLTDAKPVSGEERKTVAWYEKDGKILWDRMRPSTKESLVEFLKRDDVWKGLAVSKPVSSEPAKKLVSPELVTAAYDLIFKIERFLAKKMTDCSDEVAAKVFVFDEEEREALVPVTVRLINKRGPDWLAQWNEEFEFGVVFLSMQINMFLKLRVLADRERGIKRANVPVNNAPLYVPEKPAPEETAAPAPVTQPAPGDAEDAAVFSETESLEEKDANLITVQ